ncbi:GNAT family N-acetyltransferase [Allobacillus sp. GCM10007491]|uniref:GNAT family N-acetyltransferase n=1 Tax=Allobacillus saliphilus TaxID=2912308 RepID=A0A941CRR4_9BACI|nr:GNAT family N-acetyltransferase [Allobacillus saliphilus]
MNIETIFQDLPTLETERLILRKITYHDVEAIFAYGSKEEVSQTVTWDAHRTIEDSKAFVDFVLNQYRKGQIAPWGIEHKESGAFIGTIDFVSWQPQHRTAEIGYVLSPDYWGKGLATEAATKLIRFGFEQMDLIRIQAKCFANNRGSERVMQKVGMTYEGTLRKRMYIKGAHQDLKMYSILKEEYFQEA